MKKLRIALAALCAALLFTACGGKEQASAGSEAGSSGSSKAPAASVVEENVTRLTSLADLPAAIAPGAIIELPAGKLDLLDAFIENDYELVEGEYAYCNGYELVIQGVSDLTIRGAGAGQTELVTGDEFSDVIQFNDCSGITLAGMTLGHDVAKGECSGAVVELNFCSDFVLEDLDLYGCGTYGVEASGSLDITLRNSVIRECSYGILSCDGSTIKVENCELKDCDGYTDIDAYESTLEFINCTFNNNIASNGLLPEDCGSVISFDGCTFSSTESYDILVGLPEGEYTFADNCVYAETMKLPGKIVYVESIEEMFEAVAPNTTIVVMGRWHNMSDWMEETYAQQGASWNRAHRYVDLEEVYDGTMATIKGVKNLAIVGPYSSRYAVNIETDPRYADVLSFEDCDGLLLANMSVGHTDTGDCSGSVVALNNCSNVVIHNSDLYGCGVEGITTYGIHNLTVTKTAIRDCSFAALDLNDASGDILFQECEFYNNGSGLRYWTDTPIVLDHCTLGWRENEDAMYMDNVELIDCELRSTDDSEWDYDEYYSDVETDWNPVSEMGTVPFDSRVLGGSTWNGFYRYRFEAGNGSWLDDGIQLIFDAEGTHCTMVGFWDGETPEITLEYDEESGYYANIYEGTGREYPDGAIWLFSDSDAYGSDAIMELEYAEGYYYFVRD